jgi:hypothetical protein
VADDDGVLVDQDAAAPAAPQMEQAGTA